MDMDVVEVKMSKNDDPLIDLRNLLYLDILNQRWFKVMLRFFIILQITSTLIFFFKVNGQSKFCNMVLQTPFIINNILIQVIRIDYFNAIYKYCYTTEYCDQQLKNRIAKENKDTTFYSKMWMLFLQISAASGTISFFVSNYRVLRFDTFGILGKKLEYLADLLYVCYAVGTSWLHSIMLSSWNYLISHFKIQFMMIIKRVGNLKNFQNDSICKDNEFYQKVVRDTLKRTIIHHLQIKELHKNISHITTILMIFLSIEGFFFVISFIWIVIVEGKSAIVLATVGLTATLTTLNQFCAGGEILIASSMEFYGTLCDTDWIYWNQSNTKTLLLLLQITADPMAVKFFGIISVDCNLLKQFYKWGHQTIALIVEFQRK